MTIKDIKKIIDCACSKGFAAAARRAGIKPAEPDLLRLMQGFCADFELKLELLRLIERRAEDRAVAERAAEIRMREEACMTAFVREDGCIFEARIIIPPEKSDVFANQNEELISLELSSLELAGQKCRQPPAELRRVATSFEGACGAVRHFCSELGVALDDALRFSIVKRRLICGLDKRGVKPRKNKKGAADLSAADMSGADLSAADMGANDFVVTGFDGCMDVGAVGEACFLGNFVLLNVAHKDFVMRADGVGGQNCAVSDENYAAASFKNHGIKCGENDGKGQAVCSEEAGYSFEMPQFVGAGDLVCFVDRRGILYYGVVLPVPAEGEYISIIRLCEAGLEKKTPAAREDFAEWINGRTCLVELPQIEKAKLSDLPEGIKKTFQQCIKLQKKFECRANGL